jgi:hypothetical protein
MPTERSRDPFGYGVVEGRQVVAALDGSEVTSDSGISLLMTTSHRMDRDRLVSVHCAPTTACGLLRPD